MSDQEEIKKLQERIRDLEAELHNYRYWIAVCPAIKFIMKTEVERLKRGG